jgi:glycosyltransferase involved in cell wall biosynthesis
VPVTHPGDRTAARAPTCTVAIPVFNRKEMVLRAVASALAQDVPGLDVLVVDNCSTDGTWEALQRLTDPRLRLVRNSHNVGLFGNFNRCIDLATGEYLHFLCSDDTLTADCLSQEIAAMESSPSAVLLSSKARRVTPNGAVLGMHADHFPAGRYDGTTAIAGVLRFTAEYGFNPLNYPSGVLLRTSVVRQAGHFDTTMRLAADVDLFFRVLSAGELLVADHVGCEITIHRGQEGSRVSENALVMQEAYLLLERFGAALGPSRAVRYVVEQLGGMCLRFAIQARYRGDADSARQYVELARAHGCGTIAMTIALARIASVRALLHVAGVRMLPPGFATSSASRARQATTASSRARRGTPAPGDATGA